MVGPYCMWLQEEIERQVKKENAELVTTSKKLGGKLRKRWRENFENSTSIKFPEP
jgi:hypothetical protein